MNKSYITGLLLFAPVILLGILITLRQPAVDTTSIAEQIIRLHVLANSDSDDDQALKLQLKEALLEKMSSQLSHAASAEEIRSYVESNKEMLISYAEQFVQRNGYAYSVAISLEECYFPTKAYGDMIFPSGNYEALKIVIGEGEGKNWWCVLYPPLCFVEVTDGVVPEESRQMLKNLLSEEDYNSIAAGSQEKDVKIDFKLLKFLSKSSNEKE